MNEVSFIPQAKVWKRRVWGGKGTQVGKGLICKVNEFGFSERDGEQSGLWTLST